MKIPLNTLTVSLFDVCLIARANLPALGPEVSVIPARHKKSWIRTKDHLSSSVGLWTFRERWSVALFPAATHILFPASLRRFVRRF
jgi:hypothetical protein